MEKVVFHSSLECLPGIAVGAFVLSSLQNPAGSNSGLYGPFCRSSWLSMPVGGGRFPVQLVDRLPFGTPWASCIRTTTQDDLAPLASLFNNQAWSNEFRAGPRIGSHVE